MSDYPQCPHCHGASWTGSDPDPKCPWCGKPMMRRDWEGELQALREELEKQRELVKKLATHLYWELKSNGARFGAFIEADADVMAALEEVAEKERGCRRTMEEARKEREG